jgi:putative flippase GtrA
MSKKTIMVGNIVSIAKRYAHIIRFLFAGVLNTLVYFFVFHILISQKLEIVTTNICAFLTANICSFFIASFFVFRTKVMGLWHYLKFLAASLIGVCVSALVAKACSNLSLHPYYAVLGTAILIPPVSYSLQKMIFLNRRNK